MSENRFERKVLEDLAQEQAAAERAEQSRMQALDDQRLQAERGDITARLNARRAATTAVDLPEELWGKEAGELCREFIDFVGDLSLQHLRTDDPSKVKALLGATLLKGEDEKETYVAYHSGIIRKKPVHRTRIIAPGWRSSGYAVAFEFPTRLARIEVKDRKQPDWVNVPVRPDVFLCADGLVRVGGNPIKPIEVLNADGELQVPKFGTFEDTVEVKEVEDYYDNSMAQCMHYKKQYTAERRFTEAPDPLAALEETLGAHAIRVKKIALGEN